MAWHWVGSLARNNASLNEGGDGAAPVARLEPVYPAQAVLLVKRPRSTGRMKLAHAHRGQDHLLVPSHYHHAHIKVTGTGGGQAAQLPTEAGEMALQFEAFHAGGLAPGWNLLVQAHSDSGEDQFEINFLSETGDIVFHIKPRFSSATMVANAFQGGRWGQEEASSVFPLVLGEPFEMEVSSDAEHFHVHAQEHKVLQFAHRHRPLAAVTRVQVLSDHRLAQVELARKGLSWG
ncbi:grifin [Bubalus kerabau]|uniref:grifin n=1 Tax=Bubalus carabanensis TaxID=3119969 RepID=UPI00244E7840|nr:grifin [Bubalus carabanensis]